MSLMRWQPFEELMSLREAMDRLFEESIGLAAELACAGSPDLRCGYL